MRYDEWERLVPETIRGDSLWKVRAYRLALFLTDVGWHDFTNPKSVALRFTETKWVSS